MHAFEISKNTNVSANDIITNYNVPALEISQNTNVSDSDIILKYNVQALKISQNTNVSVNDKLQSTMCQLWRYHKVQICQIMI